MSRKSVQQECLTRVFRSIQRECFTRVCHKSVEQECQARVAYNAIKHLLFALHCPVGTFFLRELLKNAFGSVASIRFFQSILISFRTHWFFLTVVRAIVFLLGVPRGVERNAQQIAIPRVFIV